MRQNEKIFSQMYDGTLNWGSDQSESGPGSTLEATAPIRENLQFILKILPIETFCDLPCGDFNFMTNVDFGNVKYIGCDVVKSLIEKNQEIYGNKNREFLHIDIVNEPCPNADLVFCKDLFIHLSNDDIKKAINNIRNSQAKYFMSSTAFLPKVIMPGRKIGAIELPDTNVDVPPDARHGYLIGDRIINLFASPFGLPDPIYLVGSVNHFQIMALWKIEDLPDFESPE